jgi:hypothetical protein
MSQLADGEWSAGPEAALDSGLDAAIGHDRTMVKYVDRRRRSSPRVRQARSIRFPARRTVGET